MNNLANLLGPKGLFTLSCKFSVSSANRQHCKLLVIGGGTGGCTMAAKFMKKKEANKDIIILDPSETHYYQPLWTLVGAGVKTVESTRKTMKSVLPNGAKWIKDGAAWVDPNQCIVTTFNGDCISYDYLIVAAGLQNDYDKIPGLKNALDDPGSGVSTIYDPVYVEKTWRNFQSFQGGDAIFTFPDTPIKCAGAPQKIAYLADSYFTKKNIRNQANIIYNTFLPEIFAVKKYAISLEKIVKRKNILVNYRTVLRSVDHKNRQAEFVVKEGGADKETFSTCYDLLHVAPPMKTPKFLRMNQELCDEGGFLSVDKYTLQHTTYPNIYGIGDCTNTPNAKTAAAIAKQCGILEINLAKTINGECPTALYNGYGACPLVTSYNTCILAEFLYDGVVHETFPFDQSQESRLAYYMKRDMFPFIYWHFMLKGNYNGPEFVRRIINPFAKKAPS